MPKLVYSLVMVSFLAVIMMGTLLIYRVGTKHPKTGGYNWKIRHRKVQDVQRTVFPKGRYQHELKYIENSIDNEKQKVTHYFADGHQNNK